jgi:hypothetical protein
MAIRPVMPRDIPQLVKLAEVMHAEGRYKKIPFNSKKLQRYFLGAMASGLLVGFVDEKNNVVVGAILGHISDYFFSDELILEDKGFFVLPEYRKSKSGAKLLKSWIDAGKKLEVREICLATSSLDDANALDALCKKVGLDKIGSVYKMEVK